MRSVGWSVACVEMYCAICEDSHSSPTCKTRQIQYSQLHQTSLQNQRTQYIHSSCKTEKQKIHSSSAIVNKNPSLPIPARPFSFLLHPHLHPANIFQMLLFTSLRHITNTPDTSLVICTRKFIRLHNSAHSLDFSSCSYWSVVLTCQQPLSPAA